MSLRSAIRTRPSIVSGVRRQEAFEHFQRHFADVKRDTLTENRRSLSPILRCAFQVIDQNSSVDVTRDNQSQRKPLISTREQEALAIGSAFAAAPSPSSPPARALTWRKRTISQTASRP